jgi:hypothetical protein
MRKHDSHDLEKFAKDHAISPEVFAARGYAAYTADDPSPVVEAYRAANAATNQVERAESQARKSDGILMPSHNFPGLNDEPNKPQLRPDEPLYEGKESHWHPIDDFAEWDPTWGAELPRLSLWTIRRHILRGRAPDDHYGWQVAAEFGHDTPQKLETLLAQARRDPEKKVELLAILIETLRRDPCQRGQVPHGHAKYKKYLLPESPRKPDEHRHPTTCRHRKRWGRCCSHPAWFVRHLWEKHSRPVLLEGEDSTPSQSLRSLPLASEGRRYPTREEAVAAQPKILGKQERLTATPGPPRSSRPQPGQPAVYLGQDGLPTHDGRKAKRKIVDKTDGRLHGHGGTWKDNDPRLAPGKQLDINPISIPRIKSSRWLLIQQEGKIKNDAAEAHFLHHGLPAFSCNVPSVGQWDFYDRERFTAEVAAGSLSMLGVDADAHTNPAVMMQAHLFAAELLRASPGPTAVAIVSPPYDDYLEDLAYNEKNPDSRRNERKGYDDSFAAGRSFLDDFTVIGYALPVLALEAWELRVRRGWKISGRSVRKDIIGKLRAALEALILIGGPDGEVFASLASLARLAGLPGNKFSGWVRKLEQLGAIRVDHELLRVRSGKVVASRYRTCGSCDGDGCRRCNNSGRVLLRTRSPDLAWRYDTPVIEILDPALLAIERPPEKVRSWIERHDPDWQLRASGAREVETGRR